jgi:thiol-disulfide isomerase/thioredoxin
MKNLVFVISIFILCSCAVKNKYELKEITIAGKIECFDSTKSSVEIIVNRPGFSQQIFTSQLDSSGYFIGKFKSYTPTNLYINYQTLILVLAHPGDSIFIQFNGSEKNEEALLESIKFRGDAAKSNYDITTYNKIFYQSSLNTFKNEETFKHKMVLMQNADTLKYKHYADSIKIENMKLFKQFVNQYSPNEETETWIKLNIHARYYYDLHQYSKTHFGDGIGKVPIKFLRYWENLEPVKENMLICGSGLSTLTNMYHYSYVLNKSLANCNQYPPTPNLPVSFMDSIQVNGIIKLTPDTLLRQFVLTEFFAQNLNAVSVEQFEKYKGIIDEYIKVPYLINPLYEMYYSVKQQIEKPQLASAMIAEKLQGSSVKQILDKILSENKGKVIYIDCWATWCGPCRAELPFSKMLEEELKDKDIAFVYLCVDSDENNWTSQLGYFKLGGQHYLLDKQQGSELKSIFNFSGIPNYILYDKNGLLIENNSNLRPSHSKTKLEIEKLL